MAVWENNHPCCSSFQSFFEELKRVFDVQLCAGGFASRKPDYSIEFRTFAAECKWNEEAE